MSVYIQDCNVILYVNGTQYTIAIYKMMIYRCCKNHIIIIRSKTHHNRNFVYRGYFYRRKYCQTNETKTEREREREREREAEKMFVWFQLEPNNVYFV